MKKILGIILIIGFIAGCGKENKYSNDFSAVAFINASPGSPAINVFVDTMQQTAAGIAYRSNSGYLNVQPGTRAIELSATTNFVTSKHVQSPTEVFEPNTASTYFIYDTTTASNQQLKTLRLNDDLSVPALGSIKVRFVPLAINAPAVDVTFLRTSASTPDSVTITNRSYVGANPSAATIQALSAFTTIPAGAYTVKLKAAGTQNVLASAPFTLAQLTGTGNQVGIVTFYSAGTAKGQALGVSVFRHYP
ncbi:MAG: DUF4397 domain-containing protein [Flavisolibacter sp.]|nr:DUF4397 domain-containing protein [Flavisolibacter sp.]